LDRYREEQERIMVEMTEELAGYKLDEMEYKNWWKEWRWCNVGFVVRYEGSEFKSGTMASD
jgi:hypothetical protein